MAFVIEKNVPIPASRVRTSGYPFREMVVGDSFLVPASQEQLKAVKNRLSSASRNFGKKSGVKFTVRQEDGGVRVWRAE
jgi:hypothetical protein